MSVEEIAHRPPRGKTASARQRIADKLAEQTARARAARRRKSLTGVIVASVLLVAAVVLTIVVQSQRTRPPRMRPCRRTRSRAAR